jgi:hypothetical protein
MDSPNHQAEGDARETGLPETPIGTMDDAWSTTTGGSEATDLTSPNKNSRHLMDSLNIIPRLRKSSPATPSQQLRSSLYSQYSQYSPVIEEARQVNLESAAVNNTQRTGAINRAKKSRLELEAVLSEIKSLRRSASGPKPTENIASIKPLEEEPKEPVAGVDDQKQLLQRRLGLRRPQLKSTNGDLGVSSLTSFPHIDQMTESKLQPSPAIISRHHQSTHWDQDNTPATADDVKQLSQSLDVYRTKLAELQRTANSRNVRASMMGQVERTTTASPTFSPVKHTLPQLPKRNSYTRQKTRSLEEEMENLLKLPPPPRVANLSSPMRDLHDSSNESFQTAASHSSDESDTNVEITRKNPRKDSGLSRSSSGTVVANRPRGSLPSVSPLNVKNVPPRTESPPAVDPSLSQEELSGETEQPKKSRHHSHASWRDKELPPIVDPDRVPHNSSKKDHRRSRHKHSSHRAGHQENLAATEHDGGVSIASAEASRKVVFSQPNIQRLLELADDTFQLDQIDLPPDEKHLLEKFVDALSKLSVEINLDDGKRLEGKRRLHNALRAIEGWI